MPNKKRAVKEDIQKRINRLTIEFSNLTSCALGKTTEAQSTYHFLDDDLVYPPNGKHT